VTEEVRTVEECFGRPQFVPIEAFVGMPHESWYEGGPEGGDWSYVLVVQPREGGKRVSWMAQ
jgi:hypothetical protein